MALLVRGQVLESRRAPKPPMSSIAAMWLASRPAEELAPCWAVSGQEAFVEGIEVEQAPAGLRRHWVQHSSAEVLLGLAPLSKASAEHSRRDEPVPPVAGRPGVLAAYEQSASMPASFSFCTTVLQLIRRSSEFQSIPAFSNRSLEYQMPPG